MHSIVDVACGDWNWMRQLDLAALGVESYIGYDINGNIIAENTRQYSSSSVSFRHESLLTAMFPAADLVIARDVLAHLNFAHIHTTLSNIENRLCMRACVSVHIGEKHAHQQNRESVVKDEH